MHRQQKILRLSAELTRSSRLLCPHTQSRTIFNFFRNKTSQPKPESTRPSSNPILEDYLRNNPEQKPKAPSPGSIARGDLASTSIFDDDGGASKPTPTTTPKPTDTSKPPRKPAANLAAVALDPAPRASERWARKMVIRDITRGERLSRPRFLKRTERQLVLRSHNFKTSVKKLGPLARQIAGKTVEDAITQMKFSPKKAARDVLGHLLHARDMAVVSRGMGLGEESAEDQTIRLKDGKRHVVADPSAMYVSQAWVGRGPYDKMPEFRARGRTNILRAPYTSLSVEIKEEATRIREHSDREAKRLRQRKEKVWVQLPDRPLVGQRQWYSW